MQSMPLKQCLIVTHQPRLTNRRAGLNGRKIVRTVVDSHQHQAGADCAAAHKNTLMPASNEIGNLARQTSQLRRIKSISARLCEDSSSKFDNDAFPFI